MAVRVTCPGCALSRFLLPGAAGLWYRCRGCTAHVYLPRKGDQTRMIVMVSSFESEPESDFTDEDTAYPFQTHRPMLFWILISVLWVGIAWNLALLTPWLDRLPSVLAWPVHLLVLGVTGWLLLGNLVRSVRAVAATGQPISALPLILATLLLFHLLFFQIAQHLGPTHYHWSHSPSGWDWIAFTSLHAIRAADLFDVLDVHEGSLQMIEHASFLTGACVIFFHLIVDLFVISLIVDAVQRWRRGSAGVGGSDSEPGLTEASYSSGLTEANHRKGMTITRWVVLIVGVWLAAWLITALGTQRWSDADLILWPVDNAVRTVDVVDVMQVANVKMHTVAASTWVGVLGFLLRFLLTASLLGGLSRLVRKIRMKTLGALAISDEELREMAMSDDREEARRARAMMARMDCFSTYAQTIMISKRGRWAAFIGGTLILIVAAVVAWYLPMP